jgi:hypothetical protein
MVKGHKTAARRPERSAVISGDEALDGLSPIAANMTTNPDCPACGVELCPIHRPIRAFRPSEAAAASEIHPDERH